MCTSFFDKLVRSPLAEPINVFTLQLGLVYPITSKMSFSVTFNLPLRPCAWLSPRIITLCSLFCSLLVTFFLSFHFDDMILALFHNLYSLILDGIFWDLFLLVIMSFIITGILSRISSDWVCISENTLHLLTDLMMWSLEYAEHFLAVLECLSLITFHLFLEDLAITIKLDDRQIISMATILLIYEYLPQNITLTKLHIFQDLLPYNSTGPWVCNTSAAPSSYACKLCYRYSSQKNKM